MTVRRSFRLLAAAATFALSVPAAAVADAPLEYRGSAYARTSGNACREAQPSADGLTYTKAGVKNASAAAVSVWCPIVRRNSTPVGMVERADTSADAAYVPLAKLDKLSVDVRFIPDAVATACTVYGRLPGALGGVFFSSTRTTCTKNASDCAGGERTQTLTWANPFGGAYPFINLGVRCELSKSAGILGSVAAFSGDFVPAPLTPVPVPTP